MNVIDRRNLKKINHKYSQDMDNYFIDIDQSPKLSLPEFNPQKIVQSRTRITVKLTVEEWGPCQLSIASASERWTRIFCALWHMVRSNRCALSAHTQRKNTLLYERVSCARSFLLSWWSTQRSNTSHQSQKVWEASYKCNQVHRLLSNRIFILWLLVWVKWDYQLIRHSGKRSEVCV